MGIELLSVVIAVVDSQRALLPRCHEAIEAQLGERAIELIVVDNTTAGIGALEPRGAVRDLRIVRNPHRPAWFCENYNLGIAAARGDAVLALNLDCFLEPGFAEAACRALDDHPDVGIVSGKLLKLDTDGTAYDPPRIDSTGIVFTPGQRHLDRGSGEIDAGQYGRAEYVHGATGAALTIRRRTLHEVAIDGQCFDPDFVHGREDGDLCLRAEMMGWRCWYEPRAVAQHIRSMRPGERRTLSAFINMHQVKNRFLLRSNNLPLSVQLVLAPAFLLRDAQALAYMLVRERSSLPALEWLWRERRRLRAKRRALLARRRASAWYLIRLFFSGPAQRLRRWRA